MRRMSRVKGPDIAQEREAILERLVQDYQGALLRTCYLYMRDASQAEDAVQETFLKAYRRLNGFRGEASEKTWLMRIAVNTCRDMTRGGWFRHVDMRKALEEIPQGVASVLPEDRAVSNEYLRRATIGYDALAGRLLDQTLEQQREQ